MCLGEFETLALDDVDATLVVVNNGSFSWIEAGQRSFRDFSFAVDFDATDYAAVAQEFGVAGYRVESAAEYEEALETAVETDGPAVVDVPVRPLPTIDDVPVDWLEPDE
jgi:acetolactate synthase-1/2/3 large subunit